MKYDDIKTWVKFTAKPAVTLTRELNPNKTSGS